MKGAGDWGQFELECFLLACVSETSVICETIFAIFVISVSHLCYYKSFLVNSN